MSSSTEAIYKRVVFILLLIFSAAVGNAFSGCQSTPAPATADATSIVQADTATPLATQSPTDAVSVTAVPVATATSSLTFTITPTPTVTSTPTMTPSPTMTPTPTPTPLPAEQMVLGMGYQRDGLYSAAISAYGAIIEDPTAGELHADAYYRLGQTHLLAGDFATAETTLTDFMARFPDHEHADHAQVLAATALEQSGQLEPAALLLEEYVQRHPEVGSYIWKWLGDLYLDNQDAARAADAYDQAAETAPRLSLSVYYRELKANALRIQEDFPAAILEYNRILGVVRIDAYRSKIEHLTGLTHLQAEQPVEAAIRFRNAIAEDETSQYAHSALVELLRLEEEVDEFLRGMVDYHNDAYWPAIEAFRRFLDSSPETKADAAQYYMAASYAAMGMSDDATREYRKLIDEYPDSHLVGEVWRALARLAARAGDVEAARDLYREFATRFPDHPLAPHALLSRAELAEDTGQLARAAMEYLDLVNAYPDHANSPIALYRAGLALYRLGNYAEAAEAWERLSATNASHAQKREALFWAGKSRMVQGQVDKAIDYLTQIIADQPLDYFAQRAVALVQAVGGSVSLPTPDSTRDVAVARAQTEEWLDGWADATLDDIRRTIPDELRSNPTIIRGHELMEIGLLVEANSEWDGLREQLKDRPAHLYCLALLSQGWGAPRQSILSASRVIVLSGASLVEAPAFLRMLAYPTYYNNLVELEAREREVDPLLLYSVIRQESLFQSQVSSWASARGLMQVIPDTGAWIAMRIGWQDFSSSDLYLPYISVKFGAYYLQQQLLAFDGDVVSALAAYNAGPGNALRWRKAAIQNDPDLIYALVDIGETRLYLDRVIQNRATYDLTY